ncbi:MAG TPA: PilZ domain-containing protein [Polyangiaceae bacterium]|nr:PilZ domain-containing protein [Polyangiaceae bacterium]
MNAVNAAAVPEGTLRADVTTSLRSAAIPSARIEPALASPEPSIVPREAPRATPEPPPLISSRPPLTGEARGPTPSRAPVSIRRDVVVERDLRAVDAPLGAHSPSNFYTGLGGGDVVASGGLFVATYQVPKIGEKVLLKISMPGGYEFVAKAKVAWTRDGQATLGPGSGRGVISAPGFGAQFCEITDEGRRLIQRYVRNREPLFHEDSA